MSITSSTLLVELNISLWTANKLDKETTNKVTADNNAVAGSGQFRKNLMAGTNLGKRSQTMRQGVGCGTTAELCLGLTRGHGYWLQVCSWTTRAS